MTTTATTVATIATTTTTTATTLVTPESVIALGVVAVVLLITLLVTKELASASDNVKAQRLSRTINIAVLPLLATFCAITVSKVLAVLA